MLVASVCNTLLQTGVFSTYSILQAVERQPSGFKFWLRKSKLHELRQSISTSYAKFIHL